MECPICDSSPIASANPHIRAMKVKAYAALAALYKSQFMQYPPLDRLANGEDGLDAYAYAIDQFMHFSRLAEAEAQS